MSSLRPSWVSPAPPNLAASFLGELALFVGGLFAANHGWKFYASQGELAALLTFLIPLVGFLGLLHSVQILRGRHRRAGVEFQIQSPPAPGHVFRASLRFPDSFPMGTALRARLVCMVKGAHRSLESADLHPMNVVWQDMGAFTNQGEAARWRQIRITFQVPQNLPVEVFEPDSKTWFLTARPDFSVAGQDLFYPLEPGESVPTSSLPGTRQVPDSPMGPSPFRESRDPDGSVILVHRPWRVRLESLFLLSSALAFGCVTWLLWTAGLFPFCLLTGTAALAFAACFPARLFEGCRIRIRGGTLVSRRHGRRRIIESAELSGLAIQASNGAPIGTRHDVIARLKDGKTWVLTGRLQDAIEAKAAVARLQASLPSTLR